jgi:hypothetical protein
LRLNVMKNKIPVEIASPFARFKMKKAKSTN